MYRILVIDDDSSVRSALRFLLENLGFRVEEAEHGRAGLEKARQNRPDLILCDLDMPVMNGFQALEQLKNDPDLGDVPVIVVSAQITEEIEQWVLQLGARAVLTKPFDLTTFTRVVLSQLPDPKPTEGQTDPPDQP